MPRQEDRLELSAVKYAALCLTHDCNLRCGYCYAGEKMDKSMGPETAERAIDFLYEHSNGSCVATFFGGEPLLEFQLMKEIVGYSSRRYGQSIRFRMSTNGTLLDDEIIDYLREHDIFFVLSIDGSEEQHNRMRMFADGSGSYGAAIAHLGSVFDFNPYTIAVSVVVPETVDFVASGVQDLFSKGFRYVLQTLDYSARWEEGHVESLKDQYEALCEYYCKSLQDEKKIYYSPFDERIKTRTRKPYGKGDICDLANTQIAIAASGRIYPCVQFIGTDDETCTKAAIGNVFAGFDAPRRRLCVELNYEDKPSCKGCALYGRCATGCGCVNWRATGHMNRIPPIICEHERMLMPIVDRLANKLWRKNVPLFQRKFYDRAFPMSSYIEDCMARREKEHAENTAG